MKKVESPYSEFEDLFVPDDCRVELDSRVFPVLEVFVTPKNGKEYCLVRDAKWGDGPSRRWFDSKGRLHRNEKDGPAHIEPTIGLKTYFKHGKRHRISGPAFYTAVGTQLYCLEHEEVPKWLWERCVKENGGKLPKKVKFDWTDLKELAAKMSAKSRLSGEINGEEIDPSELDQLDLASKASNWRSHGPPSLYRDGTYEVCLNCEPLDDTLRCCFFINLEGKVVRSYLSVE
jgi:hypothetical protein